MVLDLSGPLAPALSPAPLMLNALHSLLAPGLQRATFPRSTQFSCPTALRPLALQRGTPTSSPTVWRARLMACTSCVVPAAPGGYVINMCQHTAASSAMNSLTNLPKRPPRALALAPCPTRQPNHGSLMVVRVSHGLPWPVGLSRAKWLGPRSVGKALRHGPAISCS